MRKILPIFLFLILSCFVVTFFSSPVFAHHHPSTTGYFCQGNNVYQDVYYKSDDSNLSDTRLHVLSDPCGANQVCATQPATNPIYIEDAACVDVDKVPVTGEGTSMTLPQPTVTQGAQLTIGIGATQSCNNLLTIDATNIDKTSLKVNGRLNNCHITEEKCGLANKHTPHHTNENGQEDGCQSIPAGPEDWSINSPHDVCTDEQIGFNPYDNKQCFKTVVCDTNSEGTLYAPLITTDPVCNNNVRYQVVPETLTPTKTYKDCKVGSGNTIVQQQNDLVDSSQADDKLNVSKWVTGTVPGMVLDDAQKKCTNKVDETGVISNAFGLQNFLCKNSAFLQNVPIIGGLISKATVCPKPTFVGGTDFDCYQAQAQIAYNSALPTGANQAQSQDCALVTYEENGKPSEGKTKQDELSRSLGGPNGYMNAFTPDYPVPLNNNVNVNSEGHAFTGSDITPDINARCNKNCKANYPEELCLDNQSIQCQNSTTSTTTTVPTSQYGCRQACFNTLDQCQATDCDTKTGHDHDNCVNQCVQAKDKCITTCGG